MPDIDPISLEIVDDGGQSVNMNLHLSGDYYSLQAEAWAVGQKNGVDVPATDPTYHNNSKYYALAAQHAVGAPIINETVGPGDIVTFADGADDLPLEQLKVSMAPVQDLHGYDHPWVAGAGKNLYSGDSTVTKDASTTLVEQELTKYIPAGTYTISALVSLASGVSSARIAFRKQDRSNITTVNISSGNSRTSATVTLSEDCYLMFFYGTTDTSTKSAATFADIQIESGSTATDFAPYANICPITGWDEVEVTQKNLPIIFDSVGAVADTDYVNGKAYDVNTGAINTTQGYMIFNAFVKCTPGETYYLYGNKSATQSRGVYVSYYDANKNFLSSANPIENTSSTGVIRGSFTVPAGVAYMRFTTPTLVADTFFVSLGVEIPADYSYVGQTYSISFPTSAGTVYGGTLTINRDGSGSLVVDRGLITIDGTETFIDVTSANVFYAIKDALSAYGVSTADDYCNMFKPVQATGSSYMADGDIARQTTNNNRLFVKSSVFAGWTASQLATYFASNNLQICLKLATPVTYSLTANQVHTLLGYNAIWADAGQVTVTYPADTKLYIDNLNQPATGVSF